MTCHTLNEHIAICDDTAFDYVAIDHDSVMCQTTFFFALWSFFGYLAFHVGLVWLEKRKKEGKWIYDWDAILMVYQLLLA